jgi:hypothetical protein
MNKTRILLLAISICLFFLVSLSYTIEADDMIVNNNKNFGVLYDTIEMSKENKLSYIKSNIIKKDTLILNTELITRSCSYKYDFLDKHQESIRNNIKIVDSLIIKKQDSIMFKKR